MKKVSIVLPTYNGEKFIRESIGSVINQTYTNWELIIVDDASTDSIPVIINECAKNDSRIKIITNPINKNLPNSLNIGFSQAEGEYYTWTSDDNVFKPTAIEVMVNLLNKNKNVDMVSLNTTFIDTKGNAVGDLVHDFGNRSFIDLMCRCNIGACFMYTKEIASKVGDYDIQMFCAEDYDYWFRIALNGNILYRDDLNLYNYRMHSSSLTATKKKVIDDKSQEIRNKYILPMSNKLKNSNLSVSDKIKCIGTMLDMYYNYNKQYPEWLTAAKMLDRNIFLLCKKLYFTKKYIKNPKLIFELFKPKQKKTVIKIDYLKNYKKAKEWIKENTVDNKGIIVTTENRKVIYPEVSGYYIPTLIRFGEKELAKKYADYLISIQNDDGSWNEASGTYPYTFDTGMILKGLISLILNNMDTKGKYQQALIKGADYILSMQRNNGSIATKDYSCWGLPYGKVTPEAIHIYCLEPLRAVGKLTGNRKYEDCIKKALDYYLALDDLADFNTLSHFNAYIIEGLIDIGEIERAKRAMNLIALHQREDGSIPAYSNVDFVCSTGLFQYAICWYKLGDKEKGDKAFNYACRLQNKSGGWYGSYTVGRDKANYDSEYEISWAVKFFLDAMYYAQVCTYKKINWNKYWEIIDADDERYITLRNELRDESINSILDLGCAYGRYSKRLKSDYPSKDFYCVDITDNNFSKLDFAKETKIGTALNIPYPDNCFDAVFLTESLEHAIDIKNSITEINRVLKPNGKLIIVDKNKHSKKKIELAIFEQWFDDKTLTSILRKNQFITKTLKNVNYDNVLNSDLFYIWIGEKQ